MNGETVTGPNDFASKCQILGELWFAYRNDENFVDFIEYNDVGLPLAYVVSQQLAVATPESEKYIHETWGQFLEAVDADPDCFYASLDQLLASVTEKADEDGHE